VGDEIEVKILRVDTEERKIGLSRKRVDWAKDEGAEGEEPAGAGARSAPQPATNIPSSELKGGIGGEKGPLIKPLSSAPAEES